MSAYKVEIEHHGCGKCGNGKTYTVVGPDDVRISESWEGEEAEYEAESRARELNTAYDLGRGVGQQAPKLFIEEPPKGDVRVLAWDSELKFWINLWWYPGKPIDADFLKLQYTYWMPEPPPPLASKPADTTLVETPATPEPALEPVIYNWDDVPF